MHVTNKEYLALFAYLEVYLIMFSRASLLSSIEITWILIKFNIRDMAKL